MPTKQNPGVFDCYKAALPDEPIFVILGRDLAGPATLGYWAQQRIALGKTDSQDDLDRITAALAEAEEMRTWRERNMEIAIDGIPPWRLKTSFFDEMDPIYQRPEQTFAFEGCENTYSVSEISEILQQFERVGPPVAEVIVQGLVNVNGKPMSIQEIEEIVNRVPEKIPTLQPGSTLGERVIIDSKPDDLAHAPEVAPHRFSFFHKGERYAYAKGLEINPTHLPVAMDAMALDGWYLCAIFGETDSKNVGFMFERRDPVYSGLEIAHGYGWPDAPTPEPRHIETGPLDLGPLPDLDNMAGAPPATGGTIDAEKEKLANRIAEDAGLKPRDYSDFGRQQEP